MRKIIAVVLIVNCFVFSGCYSDDDINRYVSLTIQDALVFENNENYAVGDTIYVDLNFSRYLDEEGFSNKLDVFESSGATSFYYYLNIRKYSELSDGFRQIDISDEFLFAGKGTVSEFGGNSISVQLNEAKTQYESRIGFVLAEAGRFDFDLEFLNLSSTNYSGDKITISIEHQFANGIPNLEWEVAE